jgi:CDP-glucose 4,6-dehydratase
MSDRANVNENVNGNVSGNVSGNVMAHDFWQDRRVFVTGGSGLVGGWLVKQLLQHGADVVCLVRDRVPRSMLLSEAALRDRVTLVPGDVTDQALLERVLGEYEIVTVFHLAAQTIVGIANRNPISTFESNIAGTWRLLEACRRSPLVKQIVVASSDKAYGAHDQLPYDEDAPLQGIFPYDVSKSCADLIARSYAQSFDLPVAITRCGNFYGGGDLNWNRIVPGTIRSVIRGQPPVIRSDGKYLRDYFYVEDGAGAYIHLAQSLAAQPQLKGEAFNFSNELCLSVLDLVDRILNVMGSDLKPIVLGQATHEIREQYLSAAKARRMLNWSAQFDLDDALRRTVAWYRAFLSEHPEATNSQGKMMRGEMREGL